MPHLAAKEIEVLFSSLAPEPLQHLLTCARCRRRITAIQLDLEQPDEEFVMALDLQKEGTPVISPTYEMLLLRALALAESEGQHPPISPEAWQNARDLLAIPPDLRLETVATEFRFRDLAVAEVLLEKARETSTDDPLQSRQLAMVATAILDTLNRRDASAFIAKTTKGDRIQAEASCLLGDAARRLGQLDLAEDFFKEAAFGLRDQPLHLRVRAILSRFWSALHQEQGRIDEALALLEHASSLAEDLGDFQELALSHLAYGWLLLDEFDPERALVPLREALVLFDPTHHPRSVLTTLHALALAHAELGEEDQLGQVLSMLDDLSPYLQDSLDPLRIRWIKARSSWHLQQYALAISEINEIFEVLVDNAPGTEAATAGLELARMMAERDTEPLLFSRTLARISTRLQALSPEQLPSHLLPVLRFALRFPVRREGAYLDVLQGASAYIERARFNPAYPFYPTPHPELTLVWNDLSIAQRRKAAQAAEIQLAAAGYTRNREDQQVIAWTHEALTGVRIQIPLDTDDDDTRPG